MTAVHQASLSIKYSWSLLKLKAIESVMPSKYLVPCHPLFLMCSIFPSIMVYSNESALRIRWPKYWNFSYSISTSNEYSGLISFRIDCFDLLAVQVTLKRHLQHHGSKASILWHLAFLIIQLSQLRMINGKTIASTVWTFVGKVMSLLFNMFSRFVIAFLPRSKCLLIFCLQLYPQLYWRPGRFQFFYNKRQGTWVDICTFRAWGSGATRFCYVHLH